MKYFLIQELKNCYSLDDIWKAESQHDSISKTLIKKINLYISREYRSRYPAVKNLGIGITNTILSLYLGIDIANFVIVDKSKDIEEQELEKSQYHARYKSDKEAIIIKFSKHKYDFNSLNKYYDLEYSKTESESSDSETEFSDSKVDISLSVIIGVIQDNNRARIVIYANMPSEARISDFFSENLDRNIIYILIKPLPEEN
ncbi:3535_t:CDS:2 [Ambispora leptoticha]|uniref:3535_t:CDS:1 n=1 Tax=Ambispora leptoticha TaxID=144679 RepID=A0A9N9B5B2_9GLOM|nr:3535_t:CDS:2 [Ambispora leptoticha]